MSAGRWKRPARRGTAPAAVAAEQNDVEFRSGIPAGGLLRLMQQPELFDAGGVPITLPSTDEVFYDPILEIQKRWDGSQWRIAGNGTYAALSSAPVSVLTLGAKGDVRTVTDAAITAGQPLLSSTAAAFTTAHVGMYVQVVGAGTAWTDRGAWAAATAYAFGDKVTYLGVTYVCAVAHTSPTVFALQNWSQQPNTTAGTLMAKVLSVSGGVATLNANAATTVTGATCTYGTDDSTVLTGLPAGHYRFPGGRTYFLVDWFLPSDTTLDFGPGAVFKIPYYASTDCRVFGLMTANRSDASYLENIHLVGRPRIDMTELTPPSGTVPRGIQVGNCQDWTIDKVHGRALPGTTGNVLQVGAPTSGTQPRNGRVGKSRNDQVRGVGSSAVQVTGGSSLTFGQLWVDGGVGLRIEMDNQPGVTDNIHCEQVYANGDSGWQNAAVYTVAHSNIIRNIKVDSVLAEGGADGWVPNYQTGGTAEVTGVSINRMRVSGGGVGLRINTNDQQMLGCRISNALVTGALMTSLHDVTGGGAQGASFQVVPGLTLDNCRAVKGAAQGFYDSAQTSIPVGSLATLINCEGLSNTGPGMQFRAIEHVVLVGGKSGDNPAYATPITAQMLASNQSTGTLAGWAAGGGSSAVSGSGGALTVTSDGTSINAVARTATGASGIAITGSHFYKVSATATLGSAPSGSPAVVTMWFYKSDGSATALNPSPSGSSPVAVTSSSTVSFSFQAPSDAAFVAFIVKFLNPSIGVNTANGATMVWSGLTLSEVVGVATQTYGLQVDTGVSVDYAATDLLYNGVGPTNGAGTIRNAGSALAPLTTAGDLLVATGPGTATRLGKGSDGTFLGVSGGVVGYGTPAGGTTLNNYPKTFGDYLRDGQVMRESIPRYLVNGSGFATASGVMQLVAVPMMAGDVISILTFADRNTALVAGTTNHMWAALFDPSGTLLSQSPDNTSPVWASGAVQDFTLASAQTLASDGLYYCGLMVSLVGGAPTMPNLAGNTVIPQNIIGAFGGSAKKLSITNGSGLTTTAPASFTPSAQTVTNNLLWCAAR